MSGSECTIVTSASVDISWSPPRRKTYDVVVISVSQDRKPFVVLRDHDTGQVFVWQCTRGIVNPELVTGRRLLVRMTPFSKHVFMPGLFEGVAILTSRVVPYRPLPPRRGDL